MNGHLGILKTLLQFGADPNSYFRDYETPLHLAAKRGDLDMVKILIEFNADHKQESMGNRKLPCDYAKEMGHREVFHYLLNMNCEEYITNSTG